MLKRLLLSSLAFFLVAQNAAAFDFFGLTARKTIQVVGSSTISPFMAAISEEFSRSQDLKNIPTPTPIVESTGSTKGFKIFCAGSSLKYPDFADSSRPMREDEKELCTRNGIKKIGEIKIGYDGIVIANSAKSKKTKLTKEQIFLALAEKVYDQKSGKLVANFYQTWNQIDKSLPKKKILIYGPPLTSGTREVFADIMLEEVCFHKKEFVENYPDYTSRKEQCRAFRRDGKFVESGENDRVIVEQIQKDADAFGIFGFNFLIENSHVIQAISIDGVLPKHETIADRAYPLSRPLFVYFNFDHLDKVPYMRDFIGEIVSEETIGEQGYLLNNGLVALSKNELLDVRRSVLSEL